MKLQNLKHHVPTILSAVAGVGVILTAVASSKAAIKAERKETKLDKAKCYIPTIVIAGGTIACIAGSNHLNKKQQASLIAAYTLLETRFRKYQNKLKELHGEEVHNEIVDAIIKEECNPPDIWHPALVGASVLVPNNLSEPEVTRTFYDCHSERYFESTLSKVLEAEYTLNRDYTLGGDVCLNDLYDLLGIPRITGGDKLVWDLEDGIYSIDFDHRVTTLDDGMEVIMIEMPFGPILAED